MRAGALTFLFTDIEASTRRWEADAAGMSAALARHDTTVREAVTAAGGRVFKHTGDGVCAVFDSAAAALAGATDAQRRLAAGPLRVRMAVHSGEVEQRDDDYFGPTLNRVARLMAAAWGGQTLVSAAAAELAGDAIPGRTTLLDLGIHRLADLSRPERIFQLAIDGFETAFPPVRAFSVRRHNLPTALTRFVGRELELGVLTDLLKTARLVTVAGVGGAGKTRLATEAATRIADNFPDGAFWVDLAPVTGPGLVPAAMAAALGLHLDQSSPLPDQLANYLERRTALVVLDNCEHVVNAAAALVNTVLHRGTGVVIMATSREPLGVAGESVWRIPPLETTDAVALLCDRARAVRAGFSPSDPDLAALERIAARLDGIPLALELAAARLHLLSPAEIAARLDDRFFLLTGGARTAVDRHRTLRAAIDWGYDLLDEPSRAMVRRLSVFAGGFGLAAAEALCGKDVLDVLGGLVDRSWVTVDTAESAATRYRLIETIRQYAAERLAEAGESVEARRAHGRHFRALAEGRQDELAIDAVWLKQARLEEDNLRAAFEWFVGEHDYESSLELAIAMVGYLAFTGRGAEGRGWLERALALDPDDTGRRTIIGLWLLGTYFPLSDPGAGEGVLDRAARLADATGHVSLAAHIRSSLARHLSSREPDRAEALVATDLKTDDRPLKVTWAALNRGWVSLAMSDFEGAQHWFTLALDLAGDLVVPVVHASAALAPLAAARGEGRQATDFAETAVKGARELDLAIVLVMALTRAAEAAILLGEPATAAQRLAEASRILRDVGTKAWVGDSLKLCAMLAAHVDLPAEAARLLGAATALDARTGDSRRPLAPGADLAEHRARRALGETRFDAERAAGAALTIDDALGVAITTALAVGEG